MSAERLGPLETLYDSGRDPVLSLPPELEELYGPLRMPSRPDRPHVISCYVTSMDGVASLGPPGTFSPTEIEAGKSPGGYISGFDPADKMVLALLHAVADVLLVGEVGIRGNPHDVRKAEGIFPPLTGAFRRARAELGKPAELPLVVLAPHGEVEPDMPVFNAPDARVTIVTTEATAPVLAARGFPPSVRLVPVAAGPNGLLRARDVIAVAAEYAPRGLLLCDAGPRFMAHMVAERCLDEFFLTLSPQVAGRDASVERPGFVAGKLFAIGDPRWSELVSVKRAGHHLLLRYAFT